MRAIKEMIWRRISRWPRQISHGGARNTAPRRISWVCRMEFIISRFALRTSRVRSSSTRGVVGMDLAGALLDARRGLDFSRLRAHRQQLDCLRAGGRRSENASGKFLKGHRSVSRPWNSLNTDARSAGVQPARTFSDEYPRAPFVIAHEDRIEVPAARRIPPITRSRL